MTQINLNYDPNAILASGIPQTQFPQDQQQEREVDERLWSTSISKDQPQYAAIARLLPADTPDEIQQQTGVNNLDGQPIVNVLFHRVRLTPNGKSFRCKCLKRDMNDKRHNICPVCDWVWNRYRLMNNNDPQMLNSLAAQGIDLNKAKKDNMKNLPFQRWFGNFLVREDRIHPENNGTVKIWEFSDAVNDKFIAAKDPEAIERKEREKVARLVAKGQAPADEGNGLFAGLTEQMEKFVPEHPTMGRDFIVMCQYSDKVLPGSSDPLPTYKGSHFCKNSSPIAMRQNPDGTYVFDNEMTLSILEQRHNLLEYAYGDYESKDALNKRLTEWLVEMQGDTASAMYENANQTQVQGNAKNYYNNVVKNAPAPTPKANVTTVNAAAFAAGYNPQQPIAQPQFQQVSNVQSAPVSQVAQPTIQPVPQVAPSTFSMPSKNATQSQGNVNLGAPSTPMQQPPVNFGASNIQAQELVDDDDLPF